MSQLSTYFLKILAYLSLGYFAYLMILITLQYVPINFNVAFLNIKEVEIAYPYYQYAFFSHVYTSIFVLLVGIPQFSKTIRNQFPKIHKSLGAIYIALILFIASPSGLVMAFHANGGIFSKISFSIQAILWFIFTLKAFQFIRKKDWVNHRKFMLRSYALTLSAISLRLFKWIIVSAFEWPPMDTYKIVSWLGWLVNIIVVEVYLLLEKNHQIKVKTNASLY